MLRAYRMDGPVGSCFSTRPSTADISELLYQIQRFHCFLGPAAAASAIS